MRTLGFMKYGISPDGERVGIQDIGANRVVIVPAETERGPPVVLLDPPPYFGPKASADFAWSPDGQAPATAGLFDTGFHLRYLHRERRRQRPLGGAGHWRWPEIPLGDRNRAELVLYFKVPVTSMASTLMLVPVAPLLLVPAHSILTVCAPMARMPVLQTRCCQRTLEL